MLVKLLEGEPMPERRSRIGCACKEVIERFAEASTLFPIDPLIRGVLRAITCMTDVYCPTVKGQISDPAWETNLDLLSGKFVKLKEKDVSYQPPRAPESSLTPRCPQNLADSRRSVAITLYRHFDNIWIN